MGEWDDHIIDWAGCNYRRIKAPEQPDFTKIADAIKWAKKNKFDYIDGVGMHVSEHYDDIFKHRTVHEDGREWDGHEYTLREWKEKKKAYLLRLKKDKCDRKCGEEYCCMMNDGSPCPIKNTHYCENCNVGLKEKKLLKKLKCPYCGEKVSKPKEE